jgi:hypothetical protein
MGNVMVGKFISALIVSHIHQPVRSSKFSKLLLYRYKRQEVLAVVTADITAIWNGTSCRLLDR